MYWIADGTEQWKPGGDVFYWDSKRDNLIKINTSKMEVEYGDPFYSLTGNFSKFGIPYGGVSLSLLYKSPEQFREVKLKELQDLTLELNDILEAMSEIQRILKTQEKNGSKKNSRLHT